MTHSTSYRRLLTKMGYYNYQQGLIYRHLNQEGAWDSHLENCRRFIINALDYSKPAKITVLGSGWLLELPIAEMIERSVEICLVDIVHPPEVISQAGSLKNVKLIEQDITGGLIEEVWQKTRSSFFLNRLKSLEGIQITEYKPDFDPGLVISLNLLTQLESRPVDFLRKKARMEEVLFEQFIAEIQKKHIDFLKKHNSIIITDIAEIFTDRNGNETVKPTLKTELPDGQYKMNWDWQFDVAGSDFYTKKTVLKVAAIVI